MEQKITNSFRNLLAAYAFGTTNRIRHDAILDGHILDRLAPCHRWLHITVYVPTKQMSVDAYHKILQPHSTPLHFAVLSEMMEYGFVTFRFVAEDSVLCPMDTATQQRQKKPTKQNVCPSMYNN